MICLKQNNHILHSTVMHSVLLYTQRNKTQTRDSKVHNQLSLQKKSTVRTLVSPGAGWGLLSPPSCCEGQSRASGTSCSLLPGDWTWVDAGARWGTRTVPTQHHQTALKKRKWVRQSISLKRENSSQAWENSVDTVVGADGKRVGHAIAQRTDCFCWRGTQWRGEHRSDWVQHHHPMVGWD